MHAPRNIRLLLSALALAAATALISCAEAPKPDAQEAAATGPTFDQVLSDQRPRLMALQGVVDVSKGGTAEAPVMIVKVNALNDELKAQIPATFDGYPVEVQVVGEPAAH